MTVLSRLGIVTFLALLNTATANEADPAPWTDKLANDAPEDFHFAVVGDRTGGMRPGVFAQILRQTELLQPAFVLCVGDLAEGNVSSEAELNRQFDEVDALLDGLSMPFYRVTGNHDIDNTPFGRDAWKKRYGPLYYHFLYKNVLFLCLSTDEGGSRHMSDEQVAFVRRVLNENAQVRWTFLFAHHPLWSYDRDTNWEKVESALGNRPYTVFVGHTHEYLKYDRRGRDYIVMATSGGGSGAHSGPVSGEFDHLAWVSMTGDEPKIANLLSEGIRDKDIRTESGAALLDPLLSGEGVSVTPFHVHDGPSASDTVSFTLRNTAEMPMTAVGTLYPATQIRPSRTRIETTVPPGQTCMETVDLAADHYAGLGGLQPLTSKWRLGYPNGLSAEYTLRICPLAIHDCPKQSQAIAVDGALKEWFTPACACLTPAQILPNELNWDGTGDASFEFHTAHDGQYLYIGVRVFDDVLWTNASSAPRKQDGLQIRLDARPEPERFVGRGEEDGQQTRHLLVHLSPGEESGKPCVLDLDTLPKGLQAASAPNPSGYEAEVAIPMTYLEERQGGNVKGFRLNVTICDYDSAVDTGTSLWWRPDWRKNENIPGSGMFILRE